MLSFSVEFALLCRFAGPCYLSGNRKPGNLFIDWHDRLLRLMSESWRYANQSEPGEARAASSHCGGGVNAPLACRCFNILSITA
jgi:hypothetical protein